MATPVAHCLAGVSLFYLSRNYVASRGMHTSKYVLALLLIGTNLPDLDFLPGLLVGSPGQFHRAFSHSLVFGVLVTLPLLIYLKAARVPACITISLLWFTAIFSHLVIDWMSLDVADPAGIELLWPMSEERFMTDPSIFLGVRRDDVFSSFTLSYNLFAITWEILLLLPFVALCRYLSDSTNRNGLNRGSYHP